MATSSAKTVDQYLASLPADRRAVIATVRDTVNANLPDGYVEGMFGMIGWYVPLARYPDTYNGEPLALAGLAAQKHYMVLYLMSLYSDPAIETWFRKAFTAAGKKLDMGKCCVRFKSLDAISLDVIGETIQKVPLDKFLAGYEAVKGKGADAKPKSARALREKAMKKAKAKKKTKPAAKSKKRRTG